MWVQIPPGLFVYHVPWSEDMTMYRVMWEIDVDADSPEDAAKQAREIQLDPDSVATVFDVVCPNNYQTSIDLEREK